VKSEVEAKCTSPKVACCATTLLLVLLVLRVLLVLVLVLLLRRVSMSQQWARPPGQPSHARLQRGYLLLLTVNSWPPAARLLERETLAPDSC
jgi:hypothetical protein